MSQSKEAKPMKKEKLMNYNRWQQVIDKVIEETDLAEANVIINKIVIEAIKKEQTKYPKPKQPKTNVETTRNLTAQ